jgi:hypothetical protein
MKMSNLHDYKKDVFEKQTTVEDSVISKYYKYNELKKKAEKWLKENVSSIKDAMSKLGADKKDFGKYRVSISVPDASKFDDVLVMRYLVMLLAKKIITKKDFDNLTIRKPNEEALTEYINNGKISLEDLKANAWVEAKGSPRLTISDTSKKRSKNEDR